MNIFIAVLGCNEKKILLQRLRTAKNIYTNINTNPTIIVSGGVSIEKNKTEAEFMEEWLQKHLKNANIIQENRSIDTVTNIIYIKRLLRKFVPLSIIFVTTDYHMQRVIACASPFFENPKYISVVSGRKGSKIMKEEEMATLRDIKRIEKYLLNHS